MSLKEKTVKGAKWSAMSTLSTIGIGFLQMTLLARIIDTHQFGLLTIAMVIILLADTLSDFGLSNSIIQRKEISEVELSTLYWINIFIGLTVFVVVFSCSGLISDLLKQPDLKVLIQVLSLAFLIIPHGQQFRALLQKELEFPKIGLTETLAVTIGFLVTIVAAWFKPEAITAIWGYLAMVSVRTLMFSWYGRQTYKPRFHFSFRTITSNLKFGAYLTADSLINQLNSNVATAVLSRTLGAAITGGYNLAYNVAVMPPTKLNPIITRVLFPAFAKIQDDQEKLRTNFYKLLSLVGLLNFPALLGLLVVAENFVLFMFGEKWRFVTPILQVLCVVGLLRSIGNPIGSLLMAKARVDISFKFNVVKLFMFIPAIWFGAKMAGGFGASLGFLSVQVLNTWLSYFILIRPILGKSYKEYLYSIWMPFRMALPTLVVAWGLGFLSTSLALPLLLALQIAAGALVFLIAILISRDTLIVEMKQHLFKNPKLRRILRSEH
ncbi:MOP flippase family protein [Erwinia sp. V71]|uniref:MOP flippase family protein n=1 Tax=Erwinia sp. V71 TaxID=3369424 RepID=UPI003F6087C5